jgi:hypothetical protein
MWSFFIIVPFAATSLLLLAQSHAESVPGGALILGADANGSATNVSDETKAADLTMEPGCSVMAESRPPFYVTAPRNGQAFHANLEEGSTTARGYLPKNTIVEVEPFDASVVSLPQSSLVSVRVLSIPNREASQIDTATGKVTQLKLGTRVHVSSLDLSQIPLIGQLSAPGSILNAIGVDVNKTKFIVRRDTPYFHMPELEGRMVRLAQYGMGYLTKRCCPQGQEPPRNPMKGLSDSKTRYPTETSRSAQCSYQPVFELLKDIGSPSHPNYVVDKPFAAPTNSKNPACGSFISALQPVSAESLSSALVSTATLSRYGDDYLSKLQNAAYHNALERRCSDAYGCRSGNVAKGKCRSGVRDTLVEMGYLKETDRPDPDPHVKASNFEPWLETKGFTNAIAKYDSHHAPPGAVLVYSGGKYGHIEIKVDRDSYCSDYCVDYPRDDAGTRHLIGVYLPPGYDS